jgi:hypothetical protein
VGVKEELQSEVSSILRESWTERDGRVVPEPENIGLKNDAVNLDATILTRQKNSWVSSGSGSLPSE